MVGQGSGDFQARIRSILSCLKHKSEELDLKYENLAKKSKTEEMLVINEERDEVQAKYDEWFKFLRKDDQETMKLGDVGTSGSTSALSCDEPTSVEEIKQLEEKLRAFEKALMDDYVFDADETQVSKMEQDLKIDCLSKKTDD